MKFLGLVVLVLSLVMDSRGLTKPFDCSDILKQDPTQNSGVYTIYPFGDKFGIQAFCDMETDGGRWTLIQRRMDGTVNFYRPWSQYKTGFGEADGEYWLGLEFIHLLSSRRTHELLVEMEDFEGGSASARYLSFSVGSECDGYKLQVSEFTGGDAGDSLQRHNGMKFSTFDNDHDLHDINCAKLYLGAFWYNNCHGANPNGVYRWGADDTIYAVGIDWESWKGYDYSMKAINMKIRPLQ